MAFGTILSTLFLGVQCGARQAGGHVKARAPKWTFELLDLRDWQMNIRPLLVTKARNWKDANRLGCQVGDSARRLVIDIMKPLFIPLVCLGLLLSGLLHLFFPGEAEKHMSCLRNVRIVGAMLLALVLPATVWGFYVLAVLFVIFGLPRLLEPGHSIRLQQRSYPRRVHGVLLMIGAVGLWIVSRLVHR